MCSRRPEGLPDLAFVRAKRWMLCRFVPSLPWNAESACSDRSCGEGQSCAAKACCDKGAGCDSGPLPPAAAGCGFAGCCKSAEGCYFGTAASICVHNTTAGWVSRGRNPGPPPPPPPPSPPPRGPSRPSQGPVAAQGSAAALAAVHSDRQGRAPARRCGGLQAVLTVRVMARQSALVGRAGA